ncbi:hypothetical protein GALMADRAFT_244722 [Galerina marginata CBS 339.88]|uniref:Uncharacterized protein n=1 Tax=Galerina marginata (strain CBS 339.88) TaxID=685588 RepID=A0A067TGI0_GALM3|nr:hypothetical protein GALMADRAFT_244722 [Galerina marginata CBS 339.88]
MRLNLNSRDTLLKNFLQGPNLPFCVSAPLSSYTEAAIFSNITTFPNFMEPGSVGVSSVLFSITIFCGLVFRNRIPNRIPGLE